MPLPFPATALVLFRILVELATFTEIKNSLLKIAVKLLVINSFKLLKGYDYDRL